MIRISPYGRNDKGEFNNAYTLTTTVVMSSDNKTSSYSTHNASIRFSPYSRNDNGKSIQDDGAEATYF